MSRITERQAKQILQRYPIKSIEFKHTVELYIDAQVVEVSFLDNKYKLLVVYDIPSNQTCIRREYWADEELITPVPYQGEL